MISQKAILEPSNITGRMSISKLAMLLLSDRVIACFLWNRTQTLGASGRSFAKLVCAIACFLTLAPCGSITLEAFLGTVFFLQRPPLPGPL